MQQLRIDHLTEYQFRVPLTLLPHRILLRPREGHSVRIVSSSLDITPSPRIRWHRDALDNSVAIASFSQETRALRIESSVVIEHYEESPLDFILEEHAVTYPFGYLGVEAAVLLPFCMQTWPEDRAAVESWLVGLGLRNGSLQTFALLDRINRAINASLRYEAREEPGVQSPARTLARGVGSCRDFATLFMEGCRQLGFASRFVSGYLYLPMNVSGPEATHAWAEVYLPGAGWKGFDPTSGLVTGTDHIAVAVAHHPEHVSPVAGSFLGVAGDPPIMHVSVRVRAFPG